MDRRLAACLGVLAAAQVWLAHRSGTLDAGYWIDEAISVGIASRDLADIPVAMRQDGSPPLYYLLLHLWMRLAGSGEAATRTLSLAFAVLAVPVAWWAASAIAGRRAGALAAASTAACPFLVYHAQETRMYSLVVVLSLVASAAFVLAFVHGRRAQLATLAASLALLLYTHTWAVFLAGGMAMAWAALSRVRARDGIAVVATVAVMYAPWAPSFVFQALHTGAPWSERPSPLYLLLAIPALGIRREQDEPVRLLLAIAAGGAVLAWAASQVEPAWAPRYLAVLSGPVLLAAACGLAADRRWAAAPPVALAAAWLLAGPPAEKSNARAIAASVAVSIRPGDLVVSTQPEQVPVLYRYLPVGVTYLTPLGRPADPRLTDWRDALPRLRAGRAARVLAPRLWRLAPGRRVVLVTPVEARSRRAPWSRAVRARTREWRAAIRADPRLRPLGGTSHPDPARFRSTIRAELFEVRQYPAAGSMRPSSSRPAAKRATFSRTRSWNSASYAAGGLATCGVISARGSCQSGWPSGSGSGSVTSRAAPPIPPARSASTSASVSTSEPRAMLTSHAPGRIAASCSRPTRCQVAAVAGAASTTKSAAGHTSPTRSAGRLDAAPSTGRPRRVTARISTPSGASRAISSRPMPPAPTTATVRPYSPAPGGAPQR
jgi:mannosyltransferase